MWAGGGAEKGTGRGRSVLSASVCVRTSDLLCFMCGLHTVQMVLFFFFCIFCFASHQNKYLMIYLASIFFINFFFHLYKFIRAFVLRLGGNYLTL